jgi:hypothetical protein
MSSCRSVDGVRDPGHIGRILGIIARAGLLRLLQEYYLLFLIAVVCHARHAGGSQDSHCPGNPTATALRIR